MEEKISCRIRVVSKNEELLILLTPPKIGTIICSVFVSKLGSVRWLLLSVLWLLLSVSIVMRIINLPNPSKWCWKYDGGIFAN